MATFHAIYGFMGVGKTTYAKQLAEQVDGIYLSRDELMASDLGKHSIEENESFHSVYTEHLYLLAEIALKDGQDVIFDCGFWKTADRTEALIFSDRLDADIRFHVVNCDLEEARQRVLERNRGNAVQVTSEQFDIWWGHFEPVDLAAEGIEDYTITNTSSISPV